jgi:hypothetical protein
MQSNRRKDVLLLGTAPIISLFISRHLALLTRTRLVLPSPSTHAPSPIRTTIQIIYEEYDLIQRRSSHRVFAKHPRNDYPPARYVHSLHARRLRVHTEHIRAMSVMTHGHARYDSPPTDVVQ